MTGAVIRAGAGGAGRQVRMPRQAKTRSLTTAFHKHTKPNQTYMSTCKDIPYACTGREQYGNIRQAMQTFRKSHDNSGKAKQ